MVFFIVRGTGVYHHAATLASWASQEEPDIDSSNEEDDTRINPDGTMEGEPPSNLEASTK